MKLTRKATAIIGAAVGLAATLAVPTAALAHEPTANITYRITNVHSNLCLDGGAGTEFSVVTAKQCSSSSNSQKWKALDQGHGALAYSLKNKASGLCLGMPVG